MPFSLLAVICWFLAARPLVRQARTAFAHARRAESKVSLPVYMGRFLEGQIGDKGGASAPTTHPHRSRPYAIVPIPGSLTQKPTRVKSLPEDTYERARQWGRAMLVIGLGLTVLQFVIARTSYVNAGTSIRYISNIYLCIPLIVDPLFKSALPLWRWLSARVRSLARPTRPHASAFLAIALLFALFAINITGAVNALQVISDTQDPGVPAGHRDMQLISFLETHDATRFYTTWWACYRLMFASQERLDCYIVSDTDAFLPGNFNRVSAYAAEVTATPHPAYVFDLTTTEVDRSVPQHLSSLIASRNPRFSGYTSAMVGGYIVFYYVDS